MSREKAEETAAQEQPMTRVMRLKLLEVAGRLLRRDGLVDLADAVEWAQRQLVDAHKEGPR